MTIPARVQAKIVPKRHISQGKLWRCWEWTGFVDKLGYGYVRVQGRRWSIHAFMYTESVGPVPPGLELDHLCRWRRCCNPAHLEPVTRKVNLERSPWMQTYRDGGMCRHGHLYTPENTYVYNGKRQCRTCRRARK